MEGEARHGDLQPTTTEIPAALLDAVARAAGRIVVVAGAGCSRESPTDLPLSDELARSCYEALVADGVLDAEMCGDPDDLSAVADTVFQVTASQAALVQRLPPDRFRNAAPNAGHEIAAALLREGVISCVLVLNFDLAFNTALANVSADADVTTVRSPADHGRLGSRSLVYLHRDINSDADELVLRSEQLSGYEGEWEEAMSGRVLTGPETIFAGLGTPAGVLVETSTRIISAIPDGTNTYVVDPTEPAKSGFFQALEFEPTAYLRIGWVEFMRGLGERAVLAQQAQVESAARALIEEHGWDEENVAAVSERMQALGLVRLGQLRARWLMRNEAYAVQPATQESVRLLADLAVTVAMVERLSGANVELDADGTIRLDLERKSVVVLMGSAGGAIRLGSLETRLSTRRRQLQAEGREPSAAIVTGLPMGQQEPATPSNIAFERDLDNVATGAEELPVVIADDLRHDPDRITQVVG